MESLALNPRQQRILTSLATDLPFCSRHCFKIVDKTGRIIPLVFNRAQEYIHRQIEKQRQHTGMVRVVILKGRQQGCLHPETRILTAGLHWAPIRSIQPGDRLVACDENPYGDGRKKTRKLRTATVEKVWRTYRPAYRLTFDDGRQVVCSDNHRWLVRKSYKDPRWRPVRGVSKKDHLKPGDMIRGITTPWGAPDLDDAWFGGMIDGEGSFDYKNRTGADLSISQVDGPVLARLEAHRLKRNYGGCTILDRRPKRKSKFGDRPVSALSIGSISSLLCLMGLSRPTRFENMCWWEGKKLPKHEWRTIVGIEHLGEMELVDIQTSTGTFVAEGLVSHNCTTYVQARYFHHTHFKSNLSAFVLAHQSESTLKIFKIAKGFQQNMVNELQIPLTKDTERAMEKENGSNYTVGTAGSAQVGRGMTVQLFHGSEVAFYENADELSTGLMQTVADIAGTELIFESTANGPGNFFYELVMGAIAGTNGFELIFIPWYWQPEYTSPEPLAERDLDEKEQKYYEAHKAGGLTLNHLAWRRKKIAAFGGKEYKFIQEYPFTPEEAFVQAEDRFFDLPRVYIARGRKVAADPYAPLIIGVDQGRTGDDTVIARRTNRRLHPFEVIPADDGDQRDMRLAGRVGRIIDVEKPDLVVFDTTNEHGALDRLHELGYSKRLVKGLHFGENAIDRARHRNMRVQMHFDFREWFEDPDVSIPDDQQFLAEIGAVPAEKHTSNQVAYLESKDKIRSILGWSPNKLDAACLTFAFPVRKKIQPVEPSRQQVSGIRPARFQSTLRSRGAKR